MRSWPSAVSRTRSQSPQNGFVTLGMTPTSPRPSVYSQRSAGAAPSWCGLQGVERRDRVEDLVLRHHLVAGPRPGRVERHELDEPDRDLLLTTPGREVDDLVVVHASLEDHVHLDRIEPGLLRGGDAVEHPFELVTTSDGQEAVALQ